MKSSLRIHVKNPMRKTKIQKAWRNICEVVVLIVIHTLYNPYSPCQITLSMLWTKGQQWWQRKSSFSCLGFSFRIVCLLYPTYYIVKVDPFPEFGDEYVNIMIKSDENNIVTYMYIYILVYIQWSLKRCILSLKNKTIPSHVIPTSAASNHLALGGATSTLLALPLRQTPKNNDVVW